MTTPRVLLCKASAGSGKTFMLAKSFIRILLQHPDEYDRILAVTFTRKATEEMKTRIIAFLTEISKITTEQEFEKSSIALTLAEEMPGWDYHRLAYTAAEALGNILHDYGRFSVMTLDSFFQKIIRAFIIELNIPYAANPSLDAHLALDDAVAAVLDSYSKEEQNMLHAWLREIALDRLDEGKHWRPADAIRALSNQLLREDFIRLNLQYPVNEVAELHRLLRVQESEYLNEVRARAQAALDALVQNGLDGQLSGNYLPGQLLKTVNDPSKSHFSSKVLEQISGETSGFAKKTEKLSEFPRLQAAWEETVRPMCADLLDYMVTESVTFRTAKAVRRNLQGLAVLADVSEKMKAYREREGIMLVADNGVLINSIVQHSHAPFVYEKLGSRYRYILLDEFQDTSTLQWDNLLPLIQEILSHREDCHILIVGDAKQSIYRWRNGNLKLILRQVQSDLQQHWSNESDLTLHRNFRSREHIVRFNNLFFPQAALTAQAFLIEKYSSDTVNEYSALLPLLFFPSDTEQDPVLESGGLVHFRFFTRKDSRVSKDAEEDSAEWSERDHYLLGLISRVREEQGYSLKDIAILVRDGGQGRKVADLLSSAGINVLTSEALLLGHDPVVALLLEAVHWLQQPQEHFQRAALVHRFAQLHQLPQPTLTVENVDAFFAEHLQSVAGLESVLRLASLSLPELMHSLIQLFALQKFRNAYTEQFLDQVLQFSQGPQGNSRAGFLEWWAQKDRSVAMSGEQDAVRIMTIHSSKGLEFKVVILPYLDWSLVETSANKQPVLWLNAPAVPPFDAFDAYPIVFNDAADSLFAEDYKEEAVAQTADHLNLLYVAFTRAAEQLYGIATLSEEDLNGKGAPSTVGKLLYQTVLQQLPELYDEMTFQYGEVLHANTFAKSQQPKKGIVNESIEIESEAGFETPELALRLQYVNPERRLGTALHLLTSRFDKPADIALWLADQLPSAGIQAEDYPGLEERLLKFFQSPELQSIYESEKIYPERAFLHKGQSLRPDLIVQQQGQWAVFDFKTGGEQTAHEQQILLYKEAMTAAGMPPAWAALVYIQPDGKPLIKEVS